MTRPPSAHAFSAVDAQSRPGRLVGVLDSLNREPFYAAYKRRLRELLNAAPGRLLLDVGAGGGDAALALRAESGARVLTCDVSHTMTATARERGLADAVTADAHRLPFRTAHFDGAWADRVLQHVRAPETVLDELVRVVRPGGRIALADPDYGTQTLDLGPHDSSGLGRRVREYRATRMLRHGRLAHRHAGLLAARGVTTLTAEAHTLVVRDPLAADHVLGLRTWGHAMAEAGALRPAEADRFVELFDTAVREKWFTYTVTFFVTAGTVPGRVSSPGAPAPRR
ncbi:methyltransferase domain-containing protein [Streptomyces sp. NPDC049954]|uniref:methyltransferase domain-containing protein n=1 Tax=Streptomyces sp. NPDC049954 TaxID=3155779 RepID=UPI00341B9EA0